MSRIGRAIIELPKGVEVKFTDDTVNVKGPKGQLTRKIHPTMKVEVADGVVKIVPINDSKALRRYHGLERSLVKNMVTGVSEGFQKSLTLNGVGYRAAAKGKGITLTLGYSHPIDYDPLPGVELKVDKQTLITVSGPDKAAVGQVAAVIRGFRPPEPYHGKGVRYTEEHIVIKVGKASSK